MNLNTTKFFLDAKNKAKINEPRYFKKLFFSLNTNIIKNLRHEFYWNILCNFSHQVGNEFMKIYFALIVCNHWIKENSLILELIDTTLNSKSKYILLFNSFCNKNN